MSLLYYNFDNLLDNKTIEIHNILNDKINKKNISNSNSNEELTFNVKKVLSKQFAHEAKRKNKSKVYQKEQIDNLINIINSS